MKTTTTAKKPARTLTLAGWDATTKTGTLTISEGTKAVAYVLTEIDAGYAERAFRFEKVEDGEAYHVSLERQGHTCECLGHLRHGHRTTCKHIAAVLKLIETGKLA